MRKKWKYVCYISILAFCVLFSGCTKTKKKISSSFVPLEERLQSEIEARKKTEIATKETTEAIKKVVEKRNIISSEIIDSNYQSINGYSWEEMYSLLIIIAQSSNFTEKQVCGFSILDFEDGESPLLLIGKYTPVEDSVDMVLYVADNGNLYELMPVLGSVYFSPSEKAYYIDTPTYAYSYEPHIMKKIKYEGCENFPEDIMKLPIVNAKGKVITNNNLDEYITYISEVTE